MPEDPKIPYRRPGTPPGTDYAAFMRQKLGLTPVTRSVLQPIPGQTLTSTPKTNAGFVGRDPIGQSSNQLTPGGTVNSNKYSWDASIGNSSGSSDNKNGLTLAQRVFSQKNMKKAGEMATAAAPFISNVANAFRRPPMPKRGVPNPYVNLQKINLQEERNAVEKGTHAANESADRNVDANTAEAIKAFNRGTEFEKLTSINDRQNQANIGISNQQSVMDAQTTAGNNEKVDEYNQNLVERNVAQQREQSANLANTGDKMVAIRNEKEKGRVEIEKSKVLGSMFARSGVDKRNNYYLMKAGAKNPQRADGIWQPEDYEEPKRAETKAYGGIMKGIPSRKLQMH